MHNEKMSEDLGQGIGKAEGILANQKMKGRKKREGGAEKGREEKGGKEQRTTG